MTTDKTPATLATVKHGGCVQLGHEQRSDLVPGVVRCAKCAFQLHRTNLYLQSGTVGAGDSKSEPCPNGCGPLWPVTWETWAREGWAEAERLHLENAALAARQPVGEPIGWYTEDHLTDRSATTYDRTVADRWRAKGWPVYPLYGAPPVLFKELQKLRELQAMIGGQADAHG